MSVARKGGLLVLALGALAGVGYASIQGILPALPMDADQTIKGWTLATLRFAEQNGLKLGIHVAGTRVGSPMPGATGTATARSAAEAPQRPPVSVRVARVEKKTMPVRFEAIGTVQTLASVTVRARVDSQIMAVEFADGATVRAGDVLFRLDARQIEAQIKQAEGALLRSRATLELNELDVKRKETLARQEATSQALLDTARANVATWRAQIKSDEAALEQLRVQRTYYDITAPITGRIGVATLKVGNLARAGEAGQVLATINQITPIYVAFPVPQRLFPDLREASAAGTATVTAIPQGIARESRGVIALLDNAVDATTGTITARAIFDNMDELLWPGSLSNVRVTLRMTPDALVVPRETVMNGQQGTYVYIVEEGGVARSRQVVVDRTVDSLTVIAEGLSAGETVVTDGQMLINNGVRVAPQGQPPARPPSATAPAAGQPRAPGTQG